MQNLPDNLQIYKKTPVFTENTVPNGLTKEHATKAGVWGRICIIEGELDYVIAENQAAYTLTPERPGIIAPEEIHYVRLSGPVQFYVEFLKMP